MKEIVIISGKGGTGKTSVTASLAVLGASNMVVADCDVDAADMHILMNPSPLKTEDFYSGFGAVIDPNLCIGCNKCQEVCRFEAITVTDQQYDVSPINCEGCGYCARVCPVAAIKMVEQNVGQLFVSQSKVDCILVHAKLRIGADNSGKLVAHVKKIAKQIAQETNRQYVLVDGSPGIGCPVVSSLSGASFVVLVTEPTLSGMHDLKRVYELVHRFKIPAGCIINKSDLNDEITRQLHSYMQENGIIHLADIPYNEEFTKAMTLGLTIVEHDKGALTAVLQDVWSQLQEICTE